MTMICELFGVPRTIGAVLGVELEVEGTNLPGEAVCEGTSWKVTRDGSLRDGLEYVFRQPLGSVRAKEALVEMEDLFQKCGTKTNYSYRTSTHVHVNVANLQEEEVKVIVLMYYLFEDLYLGYCAKTRQANRFCLSMKDADVIVSQLQRFVQLTRAPTENEGKYSALNLCTLSKYGTLEFRALEGTNDWNKLYTWIRAIMALRKAGKDIGTLAKLREKSAQELVDLMFPTDRLKQQFVKGDVEDIFKMNRSLLSLPLSFGE